MNYLEDQRAWDLGTAALVELFSTFPVDEKTALSKLLSSYHQTKEALAAVIAESDAASICRKCGGQCCLNGKYRINVLDYLTQVAVETTISADFSQKPLCPYGSNTGCSMGPGLRPADCALFLCDAIDCRLSPNAKKLLVDLERTLRNLILKASLLTGETMGTPLLLWAEKSGSQPSLKV